jgi:hypothetical protein
MPTYAERPKTIEAWKVGSKPIDSWVQALIASNNVIQKKLPDGREYIVAMTIQGKLIAEKNDYFVKTIAPNGSEVLSMMEGAAFERTYQRTGQA